MVGCRRRRLLGSNYYAAHLSPEENAKVRVFMDYDMMASPNYEYQVYDANNKDHPNGSGTLKDLYIDWYVSHGYNYTLTPFDGRSTMLDSSKLEFLLLVLLPELKVSRLPRVLRSLEVRKANGLTVVTTSYVTIWITLITRLGSSTPN